MTYRGGCIILNKDGGDSVPVEILHHFDPERVQVVQDLVHPE